MGILVYVRLHFSRRHITCVCVFSYACVTLTCILWPWYLTWPRYFEGVPVYRTRSSYIKAFKVTVRTGPMDRQFYFCDLGRDPMTLILDLDPDSLKLCLHIKNEVPKSRITKVRARSVQTHRQTWSEALPRRIRCMVLNMCFAYMCESPDKPSWRCLETLTLIMLPNTAVRRYCGISNGGVLLTNVFLILRCPGVAVILRPPTDRPFYYHIER